MKKLLILLMLASTSYGALVGELVDPTLIVVPSNGFDYASLGLGTNQLGTLARDAEIVIDDDAASYGLTSWTTLAYSNYPWASYVVISGVPILITLHDMVVTEPTNEYPVAFAAFDPPVTNTTALPMAPAIAEWTRSNDAGDTMALTGENLEIDYAGFYFYSEDSALMGDIQRLDGQQAAVTLPSTLTANDFYLGWGISAKGFGAPFGVNGADLWWANDYISTGSVFRVFGENLELTGTNYLYIVELDTWLSTTNCNPYMAEYTAPASMVAGTYTVYAHNGHGQKYGWSESLTLEVWNGFQFSDSVEYYDATNNAYANLVGDGVTDNSAAIRTLYDAVRNDSWPTIYFPAGTYLLAGTTQNWFRNGTCNGVRFIGDGTNSIIDCAVVGNTLTSFKIEQPNALIQDLTFKKSETGAGDSTFSLAVDTRSDNVVFDNVLFTALGVTGDETARKMLETHSDHTLFRNCDFITAISMSVSDTDVVFDTCTFKGIWDNNGFLYTLVDGLALIDCTASSYDNSDAGSGAGWAKGRWLVSQQLSANWYIGGCTGDDLRPRRPTAIYTAIPTVVGVASEFDAGNYQRTITYADIPADAYKVYQLEVPVADFSGRLHKYDVESIDVDADTVVITYEKDIDDLSRAWSFDSFSAWSCGLYEDNDFNSGEIFLKESGKTQYRGSPTVVTSNTVTFADLSTYYPSWTLGIAAVVINGKGFGQSRLITDITGEVATLQRDWLVEPDTSSVIAIGRYGTQLAFYDNDLSADLSQYDATSQCASAGIQFSNGGGAQSVIIDGNTFDGVGVGVAKILYTSTDYDAAEQTISPWYFGRNSDNIYTGNNYGLRLDLRDGSASLPTYADTMLSGLVTRGNAFTNTQISVFFQEDDTRKIDSADLCVWDSNTVTNLVGTLDDQYIGRDNDIWLNNNFSGSTNGIELFGNSVAMQGNAFTGFTSNWFGVLPGGVLELPVRTGYTNSAEQTFTAYNSGTASMDVTANGQTNSISAESSDTFTYTATNTTNYVVQSTGGNITFYVVGLDSSISQNWTTNDLVWEWETTAINTTLGIPALTGSTAAGTIRWETLDGTEIATESFATWDDANLEIILPDVGEYRSIVTGSLTDYAFGGTPSYITNLRKVVNLGDTGTANMNNAYRGCSGLVEVLAGEFVTGSGSFIDWKWAFYGTTSLTNCDLTTMTASVIKNTREMFRITSMTEFTFEGMDMSDCENWLFMFQQSTLTTASYDAMLAWFASEHLAGRLKSSMSFDGGLSVYTDTVSHDYMTVTALWTITDGGL